MTKVNMQVDQADYAEFQGYVEKRFNELLDEAKRVYYDTAGEAFGTGVKPKEFADIKTVYHQFPEKGVNKTLASYNPANYTVNFYLSSYEMFQQMNDSRTTEKQRKLMAEMLDETIGHELGHAVFDALKTEDKIINGDQYKDMTKEYPKWLVYSGPGKVYEESLAEAIGAYISARRSGEKSDNKSLSKRMAAELYDIASRASNMHGYLADDFEAAIKHLGIEALIARGVSKEYTEEEVTNAGMEEVRKACKINGYFLLVYGIPRYGIILGLSERGSDSFAGFLKTAFENPDALGNGVADQILDREGSISKLDHELRRSNLERKNSILAKKFAELEEKISGEMYRR
jgi:hypothetical protein